MTNPQLVVVVMVVFNLAIVFAHSFYLWLDYKDMRISQEWSDKATDLMNFHSREFNRIIEFINKERALTRNAKSTRWSGSSRSRSGWRRWRETQRWRRTAWKSARGAISPLIRSAS